MRAATGMETQMRRMKEKRSPGDCTMNQTTLGRLLFKLIWGICLGDGAGCGLEEFQCFAEIIDGSRFGEGGIDMVVGDSVVG